MKMRRTVSQSLPVMLVNMTIDPVQGGGTAERTRQLAKHLAIAGQPCTLVTIAYKQRSVRNHIGCQGLNFVVFRSLSHRFHLPLIRPLVLWREIGRAGIIHLMNHWTLINAVVFLMATMRGRKVVLCPAGSLRIVGRSQKLKRCYAWIIGNRMIRDSAGVILVADNERSHFSKHIQAKSIRTIPNGIDPREFNDADDTAFRKRFNLPSDSPLILYMGRLNAIKGPDILLDAFIRSIDKLEDYHLVFAGPDGGMHPELQKTANDARIDKRIHFIGYVGGAQKSQAYHAASFLVIPSRQEAMSIVALEAGAAGTPVLLTDACGFDDVARIGGGKVVKATIRDVAQGLKDMVTAPERLADMGKNLQHYVVRQFSWNEVVQQHLNYFGELSG